MRRTISLVICIFLFIALYAVARPDKEKSASQSAQTLSDKKDDTASAYSPINYDLPKAMWLSQYDMYEIYTYKNEQRDREEYTRMVSGVISNLKQLGVNTVFIQLRPNGDSIYPSEIYPASKYVVGEYGKELSYDPFAIFLELAHKSSISVHGWINPLRCMSVENMEKIAKKYTIKRWYLDSSNYYLREVGGYLYLDPAYTETRELICSGISEIIDKYDVDGIHIDDYFYPTVDENFDIKSFASENSQNLSLGDFRRQQINELVSAIYITVKEANPDLLFGVSPSGNMSRNYNELFADVEKWCTDDGYIDYLCPQIYFGFEHSSHPFDKVFSEFLSMTQKKNIKLIVGITLEKTHNAHNDIGDVWAGDGFAEWIDEKNIIKRSLEHIRVLDDTSGVALFSYRLLFDPVSGAQKDSTREEYENFITVFKKM